MKFTLKQARHLRGFTQETIAEAVGVHKHSYRNWEAGIHRPTSNHLVKLLQVLELELKDLII